MRTAAYVLLAIVAIQYVVAQRGGLPLDDKENKEEGNVRIINGEDADKGEYPFMVRIANLFGEHNCGGSLITPGIVLTAAHCLVDSLGVKSPLQLKVTVVGDYMSSEFEENEQEIEVVRYIVHEDYYKDITGVPMNDIALIVLKEEVTLIDGEISTIDLAEDDTHYAEGTAVTVIGWGNNADQPEYEGGSLPLADTLQKLEYVIAVGSECKDYWEKEYAFLASYFGFVNLELDIDLAYDISVCTIDPAYEATFWDGDSGGPLFVKTGDKFTQIGIVSWGGFDPKIITYNMFMSTYYFKDWIKEAVSRATTEESWLELHTGASHGVVIVHDKLGTMTTVCNDNVGEDEVLAVCKDLGFKTGTLSNILDYIPYGSKKKQALDYDYYPPFGYTNLKCESGASKVMSECEMENYDEVDVPCFNGQQLTVKCTNDIWSLKVTRLVVDIKDTRRTEYVRGRVGCLVSAQKYGWDMTSEIRVGLVVRREDGLEDILENMKIRRKYDYMYTTKIKPGYEIKHEDCLVCIAYVPGTKFYAVGETEGCPDSSEFYVKWVEDKYNES